MTDATKESLDPAAERIAALKARKAPAAKSTPGLASRILVAGTALGGGLMMIGTMGASAQQTTAVPASTASTAATQTIRQIVVLPQQPAQSEPIVVVVPAQGAPTIQTPIQPPAPATPPAVKAAPAPVTESGGS